MLGIEMDVSSEYGYFSGESAWRMKEKFDRQTAARQIYTEEGQAA